MENQNGRVKLNVGGKIFETTADTFAFAGRNSFFGALFDENWNLQNGKSSEYFINRDPDCFGVLLNLLRTGELYIPFHIPEKLLYREAMFYGLLDHVRSAKWGPFNGNRLLLSQSVTGRAAADGTMIRAGPHGGCCVAHGNIVCVYNWMLEEHPPINFDYNKVNDIGWINEDSFVVSTSERKEGIGGGMGLFSSTTGELRHRFPNFNEYETNSYTAGALCFSSDHKIFSTYLGVEEGICVWDQVTGKPIDFFYLSIMWSVEDHPVKLQWLHGTNCLMVAESYGKSKDSASILLCDDRVGQDIVWDWTNSSATRVRDVIAVEEANSICVVNKFEELGFLDLRSSATEVRWVKGLRKFRMRSNQSNVKLALHEGQLFLSMDDRISVFCGPNWELTSRLSSTNEHAICDISVGGGRLFALHNEKNVFDIWETPRSPIV